MIWRCSNECCFDYRGEDISSKMENFKQHFCNGKNCCLLPCKRSGKVTSNPATATTRDFAWLPDSASWASAKKKLTINYLSGTRGNDIELPADELRNARALGLSASISLSIQLPGRDFKTLLPATKLRILPEICPTVCGIKNRRLE